MRIAILGANGQLGRDLQSRLAGELCAWQRPAVDVTDPDSLERAAQAFEPQLIVHCAAMTHVDQCEREGEFAFRVNALGARNVARAAQRRGAELVYISTDYVFGAAGATRDPLVETDPVGPLNVYGMTKLAGEFFTRCACPRSYVVRTSGLYGHAGARGKGGNFVETMLRLADEGKPVRVVDDQRLSPTSTHALAGRIAQLIETRAYGIYHIAAEDHCTWFEFAQEILRCARPGVHATPIPSSEYPLAAERPAMSALASVRLATIGLRPCDSWRVMLHEYLATRPHSGSPTRPAQPRDPALGHTATKR